jgi:hypothetical protein
MNDISKKQRENELQNLLDTIDEIRARIQNDEIGGFVICSLRTDNEVEITACVRDRLHAIGLIETSKMILFTNGTETE